jgi:methionyl-tRNA formyltransferase
MRIVFLGTPDFAVPSLEILINNGFDVVAVVTAPDKPAGRGLQLKSSPVKECALKHNIKVLQPVKLKDAEFISELQDLKADLQVVVAFRMLPEIVWNMPHLGTWNLHGSLLPNYRGAAPINHAIINGEAVTGLTTFKLSHAIDTGPIAFKEEVTINENDTAGDLHDKMMYIGAELMLQTIKAILNNSIQLIPQALLETSDTKEAPKIFPEFCKLNFNESTSVIHNKIRGLSPFPGAYAQLVIKSSSTTLKVYRSQIVTSDFPLGKIGDLTIINDKHIYVSCADGHLSLLELQLAGKKRLSAKEFLAGFRERENLKLE